MRQILITAAVALLGFNAAHGQALGLADKGQPGDEMIQAFLKREALSLDAKFDPTRITSEEWMKRRPQLREQYLSMLGLWPLPERGDLHATVTGTVEGDGFVVEKIHYQSMPGLYVTANLYRPARVAPGERLPAIFYVCGHSGMGRDGNKTAFQGHGIWFARHGYVCMIVDTLQLGELPGIHHGTYREGRWWWHSLGYTSAGVECWNGVRGIDYLVRRPDVDPERVGVTGISGGGAATFWIAAADDRVKAAAPVSGMADLESYVASRVVNGHCDCMFLHNTYQWPWTQIAALVAPRPMLFVNSDNDRIFPMDSNERIIARLERLYSQFGAGDRVDAVVSVGGHAYRRDIRQAVYRFFNGQFKNDPRVVTDSEIDADQRADRTWPIEPSQLRVFKADADLPADARNKSIDESFIKSAQVSAPPEGEYKALRARILKALREASFRSLPATVPAAVMRSEQASGAITVETEPGILLKVARLSQPNDQPKRILLMIGDGTNTATETLRTEIHEGDIAFLLEPRGVGGTAWTKKDPPNYVERSHALIGRTVDDGRVRDIIAVARCLANRHPSKPPVVLVGMKAGAVLAVYAALLDDGISGVVAIDPPTSHRDAAAPAFLNVLRVLDVPDAFGLLAPRSLKISAGSDAFMRRIKAYYQSAGAVDQFQSK